VFCLYGATWYYLHIFRRKIAEDAQQMVGLASAVAVAVVLARLLRTPPYYAEIVPVAVVSLLWAVAYDRLYAIVVAFGLSLLVSLMHPEPMFLFVVLLGGTVVGVVGLNGVKSRTKLMKVGCIAALGYGLLAVAVGCLAAQPWSLVLKEAVWLSKSLPTTATRFFANLCEKRRALSTTVGRSRSWEKRRPRRLARTRNSCEWAHCFTTSER
jgi:hypothetical protein